MTSDLFKYISDALARVDKFTEHEQYYDFDNIPKMKQDMGYHIINTSIVPEDVDGIHIRDINNFELRLFFKTKKNNRAEIISYIDVAKKVRNELVDREYSNTGSLIKHVITGSINIEYQSSNDNAVIIRMELQLITVPNYRS